MQIEKNISENNETVTGSLTPGHVADYLTNYLGADDEIKEGAPIEEVIKLLNEWNASSNTRRQHTEDVDIDADIDIDVDVDFGLDDVAEFLGDNPGNVQDVRSLMQTDFLDDLGMPPLETVYDEMKYAVLVKALEKYSLNELERRLDLTY